MRYTWKHARGRPASAHDRFARLQVEPRGALLTTTSEPSLKTTM
jgi:hypothetical protein